MERLLVARLKLEALAERGDWDGAVRVGRHALLLASADAGALDGEGCTAPSLPRRAGAGHQPKDTAWHCAVGLDEIARVLAAISKLGIAVQSIDSGSDVSADLRQLLGRVLGSAAAEPKTLTIAAEALKRASGHDFTVWCQHALPKLDEPPRLPLLRAAIDVADAAGTVMLATSAGAEAAVRNGLRSRSSAHRAHTFAILRDMVCAAPHQLASRIFPLKTAVLVEVRARPSHPGFVGRRRPIQNSKVGRLRSGLRGRWSAVGRRRLSRWLRTQSAWAAQQFVSASILRGQHFS
jgi:hypothetical protein